MTETEELSHATREITSAMKTLAIAGVESARMVQQRKLTKLQQQRDAVRQAEQALADRRRELLRGAPTAHQQQHWQAALGAGDAVGLRLWDEVYTGVVATNPNKAGDVSVRFDDPRVGAAYGDVWNRAEVHVRKPGDRELKAAAETQPDKALTSFEQDWQANIGRGDVVKTLDRGNVGVVTTDVDDTGRVAVYFCNKNRNTHFEKYFDPGEVRVTKPGEPELKNTAAAFTVDGPNGRTITVGDGPALATTPKPERSPTPELELITPEQREEWQQNIGRGDTIKTRSTDTFGTVTTNPDNGSVHVFFGDQGSGITDCHLSCRDVEVVRPADAAVRESTGPFTVETPNGDKIEISPPSNNSPVRVVKRKNNEEPVVDQAEQKKRWQKEIGRGDTVKAADRGNIGTVTTNPTKDGEVTVHFVNKAKGTEFERAFKIDQLEVTKPAPAEIKTGNAAFVVKTPGSGKRTVTTGPAIPDNTAPPKPAIEVSQPLEERSRRISADQQRKAAARIDEIRKQITNPTVSAKPPTPNQHHKPTQPGRNDPGLER